MKYNLISLSMLCVILTATQLSAQTPLGTDFTYQGQLKASGLPAVANADFQFFLFDALNGGTQIGPAQPKDNVALVNGAFTVSLDFGAPAFQGDARWIEVSVRSPAGAGGFSTLAPRQLLTATPNATYSLQTRGISVDATGQVGIGTATPGKKLTVAGDMELRTAPGDYRHLRIGGGTSDGFLYGGLHFSGVPIFGDGVHLGYNYFPDAAGQHQIIDSNRGTSRLSLGYGRIALATNNAGEIPGDRLIITNAGFVGIGIDSPTERLHVGGRTRTAGITNSGQMEVFGGQQEPFGALNLIWKLGDYATQIGPGEAVENPELKMISPVTGDELAGFYRDHNSGNGVMFADDKNFRAPNPADPTTDIWYCCPEGPEAAIYVRGTARLNNGRAVIELPDHFRNLASEPRMTVQLTPISIDSKGLALIKKSLDGIEVGELGGGSGNYEFDWRVEAVRKGWEDYKVIRPWLQSDADPDKAWLNRLKHIEERRAHGKPSPAITATTPRPLE